MPQIYKLPLVLEPQPEGGYTITCPILPGLVTEADTIEDVSANVADALEALIDGYTELNQPLPLALQPIGENVTFLADTLIRLQAA